MQTRRSSLIEVFTNTFTGMLGSWAITYLCITTIDDKWSASIAAVIGCTVWSLVRGWTIRRAFNRLEKD